MGLRQAMGGGGDAEVAVLRVGAQAVGLEILFAVMADGDALFRALGDGPGRRLPRDDLPRGFHLVTREVVSALPELAGLRVGLLHVHILHTSASLTLNENASPDVRRDFESWFDRAGNFHSDGLHVVERITATAPDHLNYEATIEDPKVFTRPWKISMPLYRRVEPNKQLFEYKCVEFVEELMYGHLGVIDPATGRRNK